MPAPAIVMMLRPSAELLIQALVNSHSERTVMLKNVINDPSEVWS